ncbi:MAG: chitobiase/beta-hexosaminidase C-terminal domain-containing protein [Terracidiphilus sp.]
MGRLRFHLRCVLTAILGLTLGVPIGQASPPLPEPSPRVLGPVDESDRATLAGNTNPLLQARVLQPGAPAPIDLGAVEDSLPAGRMLLMLKRSPAQEEALRDFIQAAHTPGSAAFHQWLKPEEFGRLYGPADSDVAAVTAWLQAHGLSVNQVHAGRLAIEFSGSAGQVSEAFQTQIHRFQINGQTHLANLGEPSVPAALAPVIAGLTPISDLHPKPSLKVMGAAQFNARTHQATPQWTFPVSGGVDFVVAPGDFAMQYDINPVYKNGITGSGQTIAIISSSNVDLSLVQAYQSLFGLTANLPKVVVDGEDPGMNDQSAEAYLDIEIAGSVAPGATVLLYTSAGTATTDGLELAAMRAVEDDQASVISTSYGECEAQLGASGNAFWSALWQQAAAQGQTPFVATGDGGSAGCDDFDLQTEAQEGLAVNGIASTPYDVAVGGTDFYYSQYASSTLNTQLATYWSGATTAPGVSLKQTIPEQAWNDFFGYNLADAGNPESLVSSTIIAGGGGASGHAQNGLGYPKPAWQTGSGVPADGVRDLPDLSLFAANGYNYSFYPICASPGDCSSANLTSSGTVVITGVGGTSVSAPSMAAIQALVNQSVGSWQGQADFIYYPLASTQPTAFHDVTVGSNTVLCDSGTTNCVTGSTATNSIGYNTESGYSAGTGYDLATGLGSVDVAKLIQYWSSIVLAPTTTTLSVSPTSFIHGKSATVQGTVAPTSGSGTPTGTISLTGNDGLSHYAGIGTESLTAGSFYAVVDNLPGGTYQLTASYGGSNSFAASKSSPVTVTISPESDTLAATGWVLNPANLTLSPLSSVNPVPYGAQVFLDAQPVSSNATISTEPTPATGAVTFTDTIGSAVTTSTQPLNARGMAEWSTGVFAPGSHTISESYSGDPSYLPSAASSAAAFTVAQGSTYLTVTPLVTSVAAGSSVAVDVQLSAGDLPFYGALPTGTLAVKLGSTTVNGTWKSWGPAGSANLESVVTFTSVSAGALTLSATYSGDSNWLGSSASGATVTATASKLTPTVALTTSLANPAPSQNFTLAVTVAGPSGSATPTGTVAFLTESQSIYVTAALTSGTASLTLPGFVLANGSSIFTVVYLGDSNYTTASSNTVNITVAQSDFSLTTQNAEVQISRSGSGVSTLALSPINGFSGTVTLASSAPTGITVTPAAASLALSAAASDALAISVSSTMATGIYPITITATGGGHVHTLQLLVQVLFVTQPVISLASGTYITAQSVTISDSTAGTAIYYTTDGTTPTTTSNLYSGAITVPATAPLVETLKAIAVAAGYANSSVASAVYTMTPPAAAPSFSPVAGTYTTAQSVTISDSTTGATIYYTTNGTTPTTSSTKYTAAISVPATAGSTETIQAIAVATGYSASSVASAAYVMTPPASAPTFSVASGSYTTAQSVTLSDSTTGATIYYTTDGTTPTTSSTKYTAAIVVPATAGTTETIQAIAVATGYSASSVASAAYVMTPPATAPSFSPAAGTYTTAQSVTISDSTTGATIYYTTNGTTPTTSSTKYIAAISVPATAGSTVTIQALAVASGYSASPVASAAYVMTPPAATPSFSVASGTYTTAQSVTLSDSTTGATIYYTTDGTTPTTSSTKYTAAIAVPATAGSTETIQAIAVASGYSASAIASAAYVMTPPATAPSFSPAAGTYATAQSVTISDSTTGATIYYTTNGTTPTTSSTKYTAAISVPATAGSTVTIQAIAVASGYSASAIASAVYVMTPPATAPTFSVASGSYTTAQSVTISDSTTGATIYYTTNGTTPTTSSTKYTAAISVPATAGSTETIQAIAVATGYSASAVASAVYVMTPPAAAPTFSPATGSYTTAQSVTIADSTSGAAIYYTTDGTTPTTTSNLYSGAITVPATTALTETIKAIAVVTGYANSAVASAAYTMIPPPPVGSLDSAGDKGTGSTTIPQTDSLAVSGWVADQNDGSPLSNVKVYVDGVFFGTPTLGLTRTDVASVFNNSSWAKSGYQLVVSVASLSIGTHAVTVVAIDSGGRSTTLGPVTITVTGGPPVGSLDVAVDSATGSSTLPQTDSLLVWGWVADPVDGSPLGNVKVYVDGVFFGTPTLGLSRTDVASYFNNSTWAKSGYQLVASVAALSIGTHAVTVVAIDSGGRSTTLGPLTITVTGGPPVGSLDVAVDSATGSSTLPQTDSLLVRGWVADPVDGSPLGNVKIYVDGVFFGTPTLGLSRTDVASYFNNSTWAKSGYQLVASVAALSIGTHAVTVVAIDSGGRSTTLGPLTINVTGGPPVGSLDVAVDSATGSSTLPQTDSLLVWGWVADPVDGSPLGNVKVYVDGVFFGTPTLGLSRTDVASYFNNSTWAKSGYQLVASVAALSIGTHAVTVVAIDSGGRSTTLGPLTITVTGGPPVGSLDVAVDSVTGSSTLPQSDSLLVRGWVADPVDGSPLGNVKVYVDGVFFGTPTLGLSRTDVASYFNNSSWANSGYQLIASVANLSAGTHTVTVVAIDSGGRSTTLGPLTISVTSP